MMRKKGTFWIATGLLLIAAALILAVYNLYDQDRAGKSADAVLEVLDGEIPGNGDEQTASSGRWVFICNGGAEDLTDGEWCFVDSEAVRTAEQNAADDEDPSSGRWVFVPDDPDSRDIGTAGRMMFLPYSWVEMLRNCILDLADFSLEDISFGFMNGIEYPDYVLNPQMDMPVKTVDGHDYIGVLKIPSLGLELPIMSDWDYNNLKIAPCRYVGSAYLDDMVICAHNYDSHFGQLKTLEPGTEITFTDMDGNVFRYEVVDMEILKPQAIEQMKTGDWDLTLFTCTIGGATRVTVRCERIL